MLFTLISMVFKRIILITHTRNIPLSLQATLTAFKAIFTTSHILPMKRSQFLAKVCSFTLETPNGLVLQSPNDKFPQGSYGVPSFTGFPQFENLSLPTALPATLPAPSTLLPPVTQGPPQTLPQGLPQLSPLPTPQGLGALSPHGLSPHSLSPHSLSTPGNAQGGTSQAPPESDQEDEAPSSTFKSEREPPLPAESSVDTKSS